MLLSAAKRLWTPEISRRLVNFVGVKTNMEKLCQCRTGIAGIADDFRWSIAAHMLLPDPGGIFGCYASRCCAIAFKRGQT